MKLILIKKDMKSLRSTNIQDSPKDLNVYQDEYEKL